MSTLEGSQGTTMHPRCCIKEWRFNDANLSKHKCACSKHRYISNYIAMLRHTLMFMDCIRKQTYQCAQYKLKIVYKTWQQKHWGKDFLKKKIFFFHLVAIASENISNHERITTVRLILTKLGWFHQFTSQNSISTFFFNKRNSNFLVSMV